MSDINENKSQSLPSMKKSVRTLTGIVTSERMKKTIAVSIDIIVQHPAYGKFMRRTVKLFAHDEENICNVGDRVLIRACRPISCKKNWVLQEIIEKAQ